MTPISPSGTTKACDEKGGGQQAQKIAATAVNA